MWNLQFESILMEEVGKQKNPYSKSEAILLETMIYT